MSICHGAGFAVDLQVAGLTEDRFQPRRFMIASAADGCKPEAMKLIVPVGLAATRWQKVESAIGSSDEAIDAGADKDRCLHCRILILPHHSVSPSDPTGHRPKVRAIASRTCSTVGGSDSKYAPIPAASADTWDAERLANEEGVTFRPRTDQMAL